MEADPDGGDRSLSGGHRSREPERGRAPPRSAIRHRALLALEQRVGVELVRRTTRTSFATEAGLAFYRRVKPAFAEISKARLEAASRRVEPFGLLRIAAHEP
jgi:DNA-binding transcriptional LysR family regulator